MLLTDIQKTIRKIRLLLYHNFFFTGYPKGDWRAAPSMRVCAQNFGSEKRICIVGQVPTLRNQYITENHLQNGI